MNWVLGSGTPLAEGDMPRALLIRAEGKVFTGGADVHVFDDKTVDQAAALRSG